jgi:hypothetical protein
MCNLIPEIHKTPEFGDVFSSPRVRLAQLIERLTNVVQELVNRQVKSAITQKRFQMFAAGELSDLSAGIENVMQPLAGLALHRA